MITGQLAQRAQRLAEQRTPFAIATVVRAQRPTSVRAGDSALVLADGTIEGFVGGLCAESSVRLHA
ncbi:MAG: XdhC family protein, partial [Solirubrobacteraceae bacterium]